MWIKIFIVSVIFFSSHVYAINKCISPDGRVSYQKEKCPISSNSYDLNKKPISKSAKIVNNKKETPNNFFKRFVELYQSYDISVSNLYSDNARIKNNRIYPLGIKKNNEITGSRYKSITKSALPLARKENDMSKYSNVRISKIGNNYKITADRYSTIKCYTDKNFYLVIKPLIDSGFTIIEQFTESPAMAEC